MYASHLRTRLQQSLQNPRRNHVIPMGLADSNGCRKPARFHLL
ncbi:Uncharacterised protein [Vibrio cholerae]|nr:Uncharacterised protein [Vibrio cholerae]